MVKIKQKAQKQKKIQKQTIIYTIFFLLFISICGNIIQFFVNRKTYENNNLTSERLEKYHSLQQKQIDSAKNTCARLKEDTANKYSYINQIVVTARVFDIDESDFMTSTFQKCYSPLFIISGALFVEDEYTDIDELVLEDNSNFDIKQNAFDRVKF